jgi:hypothetical protein
MHLQQHLTAMLLGLKHGASARVLNSLLLLLLRLHLVRVSRRCHHLPHPNC